jgi:O-antigen/teichoic acid export membrane protein
LSGWRYDAGLARSLLAQSWPLLLSGMAVMLYMRIDQVMLAAMVGDEAVGQFSAALRLSEVWYFVPAAILSAAFPAMLARRKDGTLAYERYVQKLYDLTAWMGLAVAVVVTLCGPWLIDRLYGDAYAEAARVLQVQTWAGVAVAMSYVHGKWLLAEGLQRLGLFYTLVGCACNLVLNAWLIPRHGAVGAAYATLAAQLGVLPVQLFFAPGRRNFRLMLWSAGAPLRLLGELRSASLRA